MTKERLEELKMLAEKAIAVKPLEWDEITSPREDGPPEPTGDWEAASIVGAYHVYIFDDHYEVTRVDGEYVESWCSDADEAKAAAQKDYSKRILSAIDMSPILALVSELMALRPALEMARSVISEMVECGIIGNAYYVGEDVLPIIMGKTPETQASVTSENSHV